MKVVCVGHSAYDITLLLDEYPKENTKTRITNSTECGGGSASTGAYLLTKWNLNPILLSAVGDDYYGNKIIEEFIHIGATTKYIEKVKDYSTTSSYIIANKKNGSRTIITSKKNTIRRLNQMTNLDADLILIDGEHPESAKEVLLNNPKAISILDAEKTNEDIKELGKLVTYIICSKTFAEKFTNTKINPKDKSSCIACYEILRNYFNTNIIITLEESGSFTKLDDYEIIPSIKVDTIDSTGAGDIFHGAFTYFIGKNYPLKETIKYASITAALSTTKVGSRYSIPELEEVLNYDNII